eukprot:gene5423-15566_t
MASIYIGASPTSFSGPSVSHFLGASPSLPSEAKRTPRKVDVRALKAVGLAPNTAQQEREARLRRSFRK